MAKQAERKTETRRRLVAAARARFAARGYAATGTEQILADAGVTRGALYHHFADKAALFEAVCEALHGELEQAIVAGAAGARTPYDELERGCLAFLDFTVRPEVRRILILEAPGVLGWERWNALDRRHGYGLLVACVRANMRAGALVRIAPDALATLLNGAMNDAAIWAGQADTQRRIRRVKRAFTQMLRRLRAV